MSYFNFAFARLVVMDNSVKVREGMLDLLRVCIEVGRKEVRTHMKQLLPLWWQSCSDTAPEVARAATGALAALFPVERKRLELLLQPRLCTAVCAYLRAALTHSVASLQEVASASGLGESDEAQERHDRCTITALRALGSLVVHVSAAGPGVPGEAASISSAEPIRALLQEEGFWRRLNGKSGAAVSLPVRLAMTELLKTVCTHNPALLMAEKEASAALTKLCRVVSSQNLLLTPMEPVEGAGASDAASSLCIQTWIALVSAYRDIYWAVGKAESGKERATQMLEVLREQVALRPCVVCPWLVLIVATLPATYSCGLCSESAHLVALASFLRALPTEPEAEAAPQQRATREAAHAVPLADHVHSCLLEVCTLLLLRKCPSEPPCDGPQQLLLTELEVKRTLLSMLVEASGALLSDYFRVSFTSSALATRSGARSKAFVSSQVTCVQRVLVQLSRSLSVASLPLQADLCTPLSRCLITMVLDNARTPGAAERNQFIVQFMSDVLSQLDAPLLWSTLLEDCARGLWDQIKCKSDDNEPIQRDIDEGGESWMAAELLLVGVELLSVQAPTATGAGTVDAVQSLELLAGCVATHPTVLRLLLTRVEVAWHRDCGAAGQAPAIFDRSCVCLKRVLELSFGEGGTEGPVSTACAQLVMWCIDSRLLGGVSVLLRTGLLQSHFSGLGPRVEQSLDGLLLGAVEGLGEGQSAAVIEFVVLFAVESCRGGGVQSEELLCPSLSGMVRPALLSRLKEQRGLSGSAGHYAAVALLSCFASAVPILSNAGSQSVLLAESWAGPCEDWVEGAPVCELFTVLQVEGCASDLFLSSTGRSGCGSYVLASGCGASSLSGTVVLGDCRETSHCAQQLLSRLLAPLAMLQVGACEPLAQAVLISIGKRLRKLLDSPRDAEGVCSPDQWGRLLYVALDIAHTLSPVLPGLQQEVLRTVGLVDKEFWRRLAPYGGLNHAVECLHGYALFTEARRAVRGPVEVGGVNDALFSVHVEGPITMHHVLLVAIVRATVGDAVAACGAHLVGGGSRFSEQWHGIVDSVPTASAQLNTMAALLLLCSQYYSECAAVPAEMVCRARLLHHLLLNCKASDSVAACVGTASHLIGDDCDASPAALFYSSRFAELLVTLAPHVHIDSLCLLEARGRAYSALSVGSSDAGGDADDVEDADAFTQMFKLVTGAGTGAVTATATCVAVCTVVHGAENGAVLKGSVVTYVDKAVDSEGCTRYSCRDGEVVQIHTEEYPAHPVYYTVRLADRERQTEGHRLLLDWSGGADCCDVVLTAAECGLGGLLAHPSLSGIREQIECVQKLAQADFWEHLATLTGDAMAIVVRLALAADAGFVGPTLRGVVCSLLTVTPTRPGGRAAYYDNVNLIRYGLVLLRAVLHASWALGSEHSGFAQSGLWLCDVLGQLHALVAARRAASTLLVPGGAGQVRVFLLRVAGEELAATVELMERSALHRDASVALMAETGFLSVAEGMDALSTDDDAATAERGQLTILLLRALVGMFAYKAWGSAIATKKAPSTWEMVGLRLAVSVLFEPGAGVHVDVRHSSRRLLACEVLHRALFFLTGGLGCSGRGSSRTKAIPGQGTVARSHRSAAALTALAQAFHSFPTSATIAQALSSEAAPTDMITLAGLAETEFVCMGALEQRLVVQLVSESAAAAAGPRSGSGVGLTPAVALQSQFMLFKTAALLNDSPEFVLFAIFGHCRGSPAAARKGRVQQVLAQIAEESYQTQFQRSLHGVRSGGSSSSVGGEGQDVSPLPVQLMELVFGPSVLIPFLRSIELMRRGQSLAADQRQQQLFLWLLLLQRLSTVNLVIAQLHVRSYSSSADELTSLSDIEQELLDLLLSVRGEALRFLGEGGNQEGAGGSVFELMLNQVVLRCERGDVSELQLVLQAANTHSQGQGPGGLQEAWTAAPSLATADAAEAVDAPGLMSAWCDATTKSALGGADGAAGPRLTEAYALLRTVLTCPTLFRRWYDNCEYGSGGLRRAKPALLRFVEMHVSSTLVSREMDLISLMQREQELARAQKLEKKREQKRLMAERLARQARQRAAEGGDGPAAPAPTLSAKARAVVDQEDEQPTESLSVVGRASAYSAQGGASSQNAGGIEICATYHRDDTTIELRIKLGAAYPLKNAEVEASSLLGIARERWQRWKLQIIQLLTNCSFSRSKMNAGGEGDGACEKEGESGGGYSGATGGGSIIEAIQLWKLNIDKEFDGVEPCPICYSIVHISGASSNASGASKFPSMECRTCHNKFHSVCLHQWFKSSGKSKCVICQQPFFGADS